MIDNKPLVQYIIDSSMKSKYLDDIFINSEAKIFEKIAKKNSINFYQRHNDLSSDQSTNDDFALDFIENIECDILIQLLATSPFLSTEEIDNFIEKMISEKLDTLISVTDIKIESIYKNSPINFDKLKQTPPSQFLDPVKAYACGIMGWRTESFKRNMIKHGSAYHGGLDNVGYYELNGFSTIDIDKEEDFILAEQIAKSKNIIGKAPKYFNPEEENEIADADVKQILVKDGVSRNFQDLCNKEKVVINELIDKYGRKESWSHTLINSPSNSATLIGQLLGKKPRCIIIDWDEWWYILEGSWEWLIEGEKRQLMQENLYLLKEIENIKLLLLVIKWLSVLQ